MLVRLKAIDGLRGDEQATIIQPINDAREQPLPSRTGSDIVDDKKPLARQARLRRYDAGTLSAAALLWTAFWTFSNARTSI